jgi:peptide chain release factor subunit 1
MKPIARVLLLLPLRNAERQIGYYFTALEQLTYPAALLSIGLLESDSADDTFIRVQRRLPALSARYRRVRLWKKDFEFRVAQTDPPEPVHIRRARILPLSHNHLLFRALDDEDYVVWLNVDTYEFPPDIVERLLATGKDIVEPRWLTVDDGDIVDRSPWLGQTTPGFETASAHDAVIPVETLGGSMLLIRADVHRDGLVFPPFADGGRQPEPRQHRRNPDFGALVPVARAMGYECCAMPNTEVRSFDMRYASIVSRIIAAVADVVYARQRSARCEQGRPGAHRIQRRHRPALSAGRRRQFSALEPTRQCSRDCKSRSLTCSRGALLADTRDGSLVARLTTLNSRSTCGQITGRSWNA